MFTSKQKSIKSMFSSKSVKKVEKVISKFFLFNEGIRRSEENRNIRETDGDDGGEYVRVLFSFSSDDGEDGDDNDDGDGSDDCDGSGGDDDNNRTTIVLMEELIILKVICKG